MGQQEAQAALLRKAEKRKRKQRAKKYRAPQAKAAWAGLEHSTRTQPQRGVPKREPMTGQYHLLDLRRFAALQWGMECISW